MQVYLDAIYGSYFVTTKWYIEPYGRKYNFFYIPAKEIDLEKEPNLRLYDMKMNGESLAQIADRKQENFVLTK